jgi:hypothetical protein
MNIRWSPGFGLFRDTPKRERQRRIVGTGVLP